MMLNKKHKRLIFALCFALCLACILFVTVFRRSPNSSGVKIELFWSYREWFSGWKYAGEEILLNIALFIPIGYLINGIINIDKTQASTKDCRETDCDRMTFGRVRVKTVLLRLLAGFVAGILISCAIEYCQYTFHLGMFEHDDLFNNTLGSLIGAAGYVIVECIVRRIEQRTGQRTEQRPEQRPELITERTSDGEAGSVSRAASIWHNLHLWCAVIGTIAVIIVFHLYDRPNITRPYFQFQIDEITQLADAGTEEDVKAGELAGEGSASAGTTDGTADGAADGAAVIRGFCFIDSTTPSQAVQIILKDTESRKRYKLDTTWGIERPDVDAYFNDGIDYTDTGFEAVMDVPEDRKYQVYVKVGEFLPTETDVYIDVERMQSGGTSEESPTGVAGGVSAAKNSGGDINYIVRNAKEDPKLDTAGTDLDEIVKNGSLRVSMPKYHCWVYQYEGSLYWIADEGFIFEEDGTTRIQYQLWTTTYTKLPKSRTDQNCYWDNLSCEFEEYEVTDEMNCGKYRVMKRELPTEYSISSIMTGYFVNNDWVWEKYFWPVWELSK